ncbi:metalloprotease [Jidongwangia harbinensis]|uniref:metalloprotease n=1 Tax=Jidongwangia harbinensis TaxID=2878561 RepID=UPI001CDA53C8|nr:M50 family metallopeptidase [Jidongwangia harbinensis]MCA2213452.1 M50 family metallopeptidase [Jidongwangia harbinensis]
MNVWEALAGREPGTPSGPADPGLWGAVVERLNPARARPVLRAGIEAVELTSVRGSVYVMLRSPDDGSRACYLRLTPEEWQLATMMDGSYTVARLVAEFARIAGRLSPDQVRRIVADLAGNRMLEELPIDAFGPLQEIVQRPLAARMGRSLLAAARGRRMLMINIDPVITALYRGGGRFLFHRASAIALAVISLVGAVLFLGTWWRGSQAVFLSGGSYLLGAVVLLLLNVVALACHELGHALATKHAGRHVPAAGLLVYFGIPSVFVDTTDVWMAGRRARMLVTAAGPASGLVLAGIMQLVGLAVPGLGPLAFKLAFVWYLNVLFNLNPFLTLDGYYLLMDWLEIPNLRSRGLSWVTGRLRGRPPRWSMLDREGRIVALYGVLAVLWLVIAANLAYRIWSDRVSGLTTGLWHSGIGGQLLLILVLLGLTAPLIYLAVGRLTRAFRRWRLAAVEREHEADMPRRLAALRASDLGGLPEPALAALASRARWMHPPTGRQVVLAGASQSAVYVVVDGAMQARLPNDPGGVIRHHVGTGGVVGLANALTGRSTALNWYTAGTTLLSLPTATVAAVVGPLPGPPPNDRAEAEALFADTPALASLAVDERLALIASAHPVDLDPGAPVSLPGPTHAVVVESGVIAMPDGVELRRGTLVGPVGDGSPGVVAQSRTPVRLWVIPDASTLPALVGAAHRGPVAGPPVVGRTALQAGVHPGGVYPPLAVPPGPPDGTEDPDVDRRFERRLWWLVLLLLLLALLLTGANLVPGPAWAEMPTNRALLTAERGRLIALIGGQEVALDEGDRRYVETGTRVEVPPAATGRLTFQGGSATVLCPGSRTQVGRLWTATNRSRAPHATLAIDNGRLLADTTSTSGAFRPLALVVNRPLGEVVNTGEAWYAVEPSAVSVSTGRVTVAGTRSEPTGGALSCGDGVPVTPPAAGPSETPSELPSELPSVTPSTSPTTVPPTTDAPVQPRPLPPPVVDDPDDDEEETEDPPPTTRTPTRTTTRPPTTPTTTPPTSPTTTPPTSSDPDPSESGDGDGEGEGEGGDGEVTPSTSNTGISVPPVIIG